MSIEPDEKFVMLCMLKDSEISANRADFYEWNEDRSQLFGGEWTADDSKDLCRFTTIGVLFHFVFWPKYGSGYEQPEDTFKTPDSTLEPIERDIIAYSQRDLNNRPLQSRIISSGRANTSVRISFPQTILYGGEGENYGIRLPHEAAIRTVTCDLTKAATLFRNGACVFHLGISADFSLAAYKTKERNWYHVLEWRLAKERGSYAVAGAAELVWKLKNKFAEYHSAPDSSQIYEQLIEHIKNVAALPVPQYPQYRLLIQACFHIRQFHESALNEFEVTQLVKLWEGGESYDPLNEGGKSVRGFPENRVEFGGSDFKSFAVENFNTMLDQINPQVLDLRIRSDGVDVIIPGTEQSRIITKTPEEESGNRLYLVGGTVEALNGESLEFLRTYLDEINQDRPAHATPNIKADVERIREHLHRAQPRKKPSVPVLQSEKHSIGRALTAIGTGLFDVQNLDDDEMADSLKNFEFDTQKRAILVNKGTLLSIESEERMVEDHGGKMCCSPYLWLPHTVAIYNNLVLRSADQKFQSAQVPGIEQDYQGAELRLRELLQKDYIEEAFHYQLEKDLTRKCHENRGLLTQYATANRRLDAINGILDEMRHSRERIQGWILELFVAILAVVQVLSGYAALREVIGAMPGISLTPYYTRVVLGVAWASSGLLFLIGTGSGILQRVAKYKWYVCPAFFLAYLGSVLYPVVKPALPWLQSLYALICFGVAGMCVVLMLYNYVYISQPQIAKRMSGGKYLVACAIMMVFLMGSFFLIHEWAELVPKEKASTGELQITRELIGLREDVKGYDGKQDSRHLKLLVSLEKLEGNNINAVLNELRAFVGDIKTDLRALTDNSGKTTSILEANFDAKLSTFINQVDNDITQTAYDIDLLDLEIGAVNVTEGNISAEWNAYLKKALIMTYRKLEEISLRIEQARKIVVKLNFESAPKDETERPPNSTTTLPTDCIECP
jgi:hypothetical protein